MKTVDDIIRQKVEIENLLLFGKANPTLEEMIRATERERLKILFLGLGTIFVLVIVFLLK